jgi:putative SOS response-associated peptidase YedK
MCNHKSQTIPLSDLSDYYSAEYDKVLEEVYKPRFHENAFDHFATPIVTADHSNQLRLLTWGFIPHWSKSKADALKIRTSTVNCISEEMYDKPGFRDAAKNNQRCLIPCTGFYEWKHLNNGKVKIPHYIGLKSQKVFSIAGLYSNWKDKESGESLNTYTVLTTTANPLMSEIHNSKKRMPVIIPREFEKDWLNTELTKDDVLALCAPINDSTMQAHTISRLITTRGADTNVPQVMSQVSYKKT